MTQGMIITKPGSSIVSKDPRNYTLDTREVGGLKVHSTHYIGPEDYTEIYNAAGPFGGSFFDFGRIRIPHNLGFPPAFKAYLVSPTITQVLPVALTEGVVTISSNSTEVLVEKAPIVGRTGGPYYLTIVIFAENLDSYDT
jgi:hypothetical protein